MKFKSPLAPKEYLSALKSRKGKEYSTPSRISVHTVGRFFSLTRSVRDFGESIKDRSTVNSALGYVCKTKDGCEICFIRTSGLLYPLAILPIFPVWFLICALSNYFFNDYLPPLSELLYTSGMLSIFTLVVILMNAFAQTFYEINTETSREIQAILIDPQDPFSFLNNQNKFK